MSNRLSSALIILLLSMVAGSASYAYDEVLPDDSISVSLITCLPGNQVYELEGHSALRIKRGDNDLAVNYGIFDFDSPNFIYRFVKGETDYKVAAYPFEYFMADYMRQGRRVVEQHLNLTQQQAHRLTELLSENLRPENRTYRYNYVKDNCSTRPLAMLEAAMGDTLSFTAPDSTADWTFRNAMRRYHANYPWYQFGIDLALGSGIDYPLSTREKAFAPDMLLALMSTATAIDSAGNRFPIVDTTETLWEGEPSGSPLPPTPWHSTPLFVALCLLAATAIVTIHDCIRRKVTRWFDSILFTLFGIAGCVITFLVFVSSHEATSPNWLIVWLNPFCLIVPLFIYTKKCAGLLKWYEIINFAALFLLSVTWPFTGQSGNSAFIPLLISDAMLSVRYVYITCVERKTPA